MHCDNMQKSQRTLMCYSDTIWLDQAGGPNHYEAHFKSCPVPLWYTQVASYEQWANEI